MELKPINPFYQQGRVSNVSTFALRNTYSYPFAWIEPVLDRSQADVDYAKMLLSMSWDELLSVERKEAFLGGLKGCMNRSDLERIENNIQILLDVLEIDSSSYVGAVPEFPDTVYFAQMHKNVDAIRNAYCVHADTPNTPQLPFNTWQKYNDIEKILADVYEVVSSQLKYYAGSEIYAGDIVGLIL